MATFKKYKITGGIPKYKGLIEGKTEEEVLDRLKREEGEEPDFRYVLERV